MTPLFSKWSNSCSTLLLRGKGIEKKLQKHGCAFVSIVNLAVVPLISPNSSLNTWLYLFSSLSSCWLVSDKCLNSSQSIFILVTSLFQANWDQSHQRHVTATFLTTAYTSQLRRSLLVLKVSHQCKYADEQTMAAVMIAYFLFITGWLYVCLLTMKFPAPMSISIDIKVPFSLNVTILGTQLLQIL